MKKLVNNFKGKAEILDARKIAKVSSAGLLGLLLLGGGSAFAYKMYDNVQDSKERQAQTTLIRNQAQAENISLKSEDEIKNVVAQVIGIDISAVTFEEISLSDGISVKHGKSKESKSFDFRNKISRNSESFVNSNSGQLTETNQVSTSSTYVYNIKATANSMKYRFSVDATSGKVIFSRVKN